MGSLFIASYLSMAEDSGEDKSEEATGKKKEDARRKGQIPKSKELTTVVSMLAASAGLYYLGGQLGQDIGVMVTDHLTITREEIYDPQNSIKVVGEALKEMVVLITPISIVMLIAAFLGNIMLGGFNFSTESLKPKLSKLNPISGLKRMFSLNSTIELLKSLVKFVIPGSMLVYLLWKFAGDFMAMADVPLEAAIQQTWEIILTTFILMSISLIILALFDVPYQLWKHNKQLKMTKTEVKEERKSQDGNPEIKAKIKQKQFEMAFQRMMQQMPDADVVITNPTHFAVALKYDTEGSGAPILIAKGGDHVAAEIRKVAEAHQITIMMAPLLARAIFHSTELDQPIPEGLYVAVAKVLAYVFQLRTSKEFGGEIPNKPRPADLPIPEELVR
ncbi:MAG: flagellar biosynthesis protein FlhB [Methylococcales bacterium]|jgi:flagellar biosynthesis protein FlhB|nr:flagellar biosynthesis protein FlhB [Methylococcales bacterium]MBT7410518.1 flagellar biosynthesis protein FlhB [Methylococcales bacterium]